MGSFERPYANLYEKRGKKDPGKADESKERKTFEEHWGWLVVLDSLSEGDYLKWERYYQMNIIEFLNLLGYHKDKMKKLKEEYNEAKRLYGKS